jgi:3-phenylpropionate/trans-cinnamate dioxygenase ferredoxin subunit
VIPQRVGAGVTIEARENGPYLIAGDVEVCDAHGRKFVRPQGTAIALCRCGNSANKPFCDGSHKRIAFQADDTAERVED